MCVCVCVCVHVYVYVCVCVNTLSSRPQEVYTSHQVLGVRLAAVTILRPETTYSWMYSNLIGRSVRLQPLHYSSNDDCVHCIVKYKKVRGEH